MLCWVNRATLDLLSLFCAQKSNQKRLGCIEMLRLRSRKIAKNDLFKKTRRLACAGVNPESTHRLEQFLKRPFLPTARDFSGRSRHFYKAGLRRGEKIKPHFFFRVSSFMLIDKILFILTKLDI